MTVLQGNIGATERGLPFLEEEEIIPAILDVSERNPICSVKGYEVLFLCTDN